MAVAKVEALTRQLEELRRDRRGPLNLGNNGTTTLGNNGISGVNSSTNANGANANQQNATSTAARELDKLRRELMVSNNRHYVYFLLQFVMMITCCSVCTLG